MISQAVQIDQIVLQSVATFAIMSREVILVFYIFAKKKHILKVGKEAREDLTWNGQNK